MIEAFLESIKDECHKNLTYFTFEITKDTPAGDVFDKQTLNEFMAGIEKKSKIAFNISATNILKDNISLEKLLHVLKKESL